MLVGYKLTNSLGTVLQEWGGVWGITPSPPNPLTLPDGVIICGAVENGVYGDYTLAGWYIDTPPKFVPASITQRQARLVLNANGMLDAVEAMVASLGREAQISWEYAVEIKRTDPLLLGLGANLNLTQDQIDDLFIAAAQIT